MALFISHWSQQEQEQGHHVTSTITHWSLTWPFPGTCPGSFSLRFYGNGVRGCHINNGDGDDSGNYDRRNINNDDDNGIYNKDKKG